MYRRQEDSNAVMPRYLRRQIGRRYHVGYVAGPRERGNSAEIAIVAAVAVAM